MDVLLDFPGPLLDAEFDLRVRPRGSAFGVGVVAAISRPVRRSLRAEASETEDGADAADQRLGRAAACEQGTVAGQAGCNDGAVRLEN